MKKLIGVSRIVILLVYLSYSGLFFALNLEADPVISLRGAFFCFILGAYSLTVLGSGYFQRWNRISIALAISLAAILLFETAQMTFVEGPIAYLYWSTIIGFPAFFEFAAHWSGRQPVSGRLA